MTKTPPPPKHRLRDLVVAGLVGAVVLAVVMNRAGPGISEPEHRDLFEKVFGRPVPASVQVKHASIDSDWSGSKNVWMHFRISPEDFEKLLQAEPYDRYSSGALHYAGYEPPSWWTAHLLVAGREDYGREIVPQFGRDHSTRDFAVSGKKDEVFLLMRNWYD